MPHIVNMLLNLKKRLVNALNFITIYIFCLLGNESKLMLEIETSKVINIISLFCLFESKLKAEMFIVIVVSY